MDEKAIPLGIDHGWSYIKTRNSCFVSGVAELGSEPMTLVAVAKELKARGMKNAKVVLAVGLPIGRFGAEKKDFINYQSKNRMVRFRYEKTQYLIAIEKVLVYPPCYGAVVDRLPGMAGQEFVVDIGSWTVDTLKIIDWAPDESSSGSDPNGIITCMRRIDEECVRKMNTKVDEFMIREVMVKGTANLDQEYIDIIKKEIVKYNKSVFRIIAESGVNVKTTPITFVGGGAGLKQRNISFIEDVRANAIGYETMAALYLSKRRTA